MHYVDDYVDSFMRLPSWNSEIKFVAFFKSFSFTQVLTQTTLYSRPFFVSLMFTIFLISQSSSEFSTRPWYLNSAWDKLIDLKLRFFSGKNFRFLKILASEFCLTLSFWCQKSTDFGFKGDCKSNLWESVGCSDQVLWDVPRSFSFNGFKPTDPIPSISSFVLENMKLFAP